MQKNIGTIDKTIRIGVGALLVGYGLFSGSYIAIVIGAIPLITSLVNFCPIYGLLGLSTCKNDDRECK